MAKLIGKFEWKSFKEFNNVKDYFKWEKEQLGMLQKISNKATIKNPIGFLLTFPVADGNAVYQVRNINPLELIWIPFGDCYQIPDAYIKGLSMKDVILQIKRDKLLESMFNK